MAEKTVLADKENLMMKERAVKVVVRLKVCGVREKGRLATEGEGFKEWLGVE